jgi:hypothetical protein
MSIKRKIMTLLDIIYTYRKVNYIYDKFQYDYKSSKVNIGRIQSDRNRNLISINSFRDVEFQVFSQFGDDGIIQWLINQLPIINKTFIEFGVEDYRESNTRFLLINNYWSGLVIDGDKQNVDLILSSKIASFYDLQAEHAFITRDNINNLIGLAKFNHEIALLNIDIDGNDYWVWESITCINPVIVVCEYNGLFGFNNPYTIDYDAAFVRGNILPFNYYGSSLLSLCDLAKAKGYCFVGSNSAGNNAYFIRSDFMKYLSIPELSAEQGYTFPVFTEALDRQGNFIRGLEKVKTLDGLKVYNTRLKSNENINAQLIINSLVDAKKINRF